MQTIYLGTTLQQEGYSDYSLPSYRWYMMDTETQGITVAYQTASGIVGSYGIPSECVPTASEIPIDVWLTYRMLQPY